MVCWCDVTWCTLASQFRKNEFGILEILDDDPLFDMLKMIEEDADPALLAERMDAADSSKLLTNIQPKPLPQSTAAASHTTTTTTSAADQASTSAYRDGVTFAQCKECGCHGPLADFLNGGNFCTKRCLCLHNRRYECHDLKPMATLF